MTVSSSPPSGETGLAAYLAAIRAFPPLDPEEERAFAASYAATGDEGAAAKLVNSHLRLVMKIAMRYRRWGLPVADLIAEGNVGLLKAVRKFDPERGARLSTYAMWWIRASINEYILANWSLVKIGAASAQKRIFYNLRKVKMRLGASANSALSDGHAAQIAETLRVKTADVLAMNARLSGRDCSLNAPLGEDGGGERLDLLMDDGPSQEERLEAREQRQRSRRLVRSAMGVLNERETRIIVQRRLTDDPATLESLGREFGVSRERVRQIEARAMQKLEGEIRALISLEDPGARAGAWKDAAPSLAAS